MLQDFPRLFAATSLATLLFSVTACSSTEPTSQDAAAQDAAASTGEVVSLDDVTNTSGLAPQDGGQGGQGGVEAQRTAFLVQRYLEEARRLQLARDLEEALLVALRAKDLAPQNEEVRQLIANINGELGRPAGEVLTYADQQNRLAQIREQRAVAEVERQVAAAEQAISEGRFDVAIDELRAAQLSIRVGRAFDWGTLEGRVDTMLEQARADRRSRQQAEIEAAESETLARLRAAEAERNARRQAQVDGLIATASKAFEQRRFRLSQDLAYEAMQIDATSRLAQELHDAATKALRVRNQEAYWVAKRQQVKKMLEAELELKIPQTQTLRVDAKVWDMAMKRSAGEIRGLEVDPDDAAVWELLRSRKVPPVSFTEETGDYPTVINWLRTTTELPVIVTPAANDVIDSEGLTMDITLVAGITVSNFLDQMTKFKSEELAWTVRNGVVELTSRENASGQNVLVTHDVRDLVFLATEFLPPVVRDIPGSDSGDSSPLGGEGDEKISFIELDTLITNIQDATGQDYWGGDSGANIDSSDSGYLLVTATPEKQREVRQFLDDQRRFATSVVTIESKFLNVSRNFLQQIGVDFRGLGGAGNKGTVATLDDITNGLDDNSSRGLDNSGTSDPAGNPSSGAFYNDGGDGDVRARTENFFSEGLGNALDPTGGATAALTLLDDLELQMVIRAVEKREDAQVVNSQILTVRNADRANVAVINQTSYVRDFDVEVAQSSFIADPKVDVIQDGVVLDVKPVINYDRKHITLTLQPTVAKLIRPIPTFTTSLAGSTLPVTLQLPQMTVQQLATTAVVPDGGSVLIGGLREVLQRERRAEVPVFANIPLLGFFFKEEGVVDENSSLMVLVSAKLTNIREAMAAGTR